MRPESAAARQPAGELVLPARLGADRTARAFGVATRHYVPNKPDDVGFSVSGTVSGIEIKLPAPLRRGEVGERPAPERPDATDWDLGRELPPRQRAVLTLRYGYTCLRDDDSTTIAFDQLMRIPYFEAGLRNSLLVSTTAAIVTTLLGLLGAYAIARLRFPGRSATYTAVMIAYMLPGVALLVPLVAIFKGLGLIDTLPGMAIGHIALTVPLVTWILIGTFDGVEPDLEHAARIDGASRLQALRRVVLPVTVPSIVTAAVFAFVLSWNDLLVSKVLYVGSTPMLAPAIVNLMDPINRIEPQLSMAGLIASIPVLALALLMQRYLIRGLGEGAVK